MLSRTFLDSSASITQLIHASIFRSLYMLGDRTTHSESRQQRRANPADKGTDWFKKVDACGVADHLVVSCKAQHFLPLNVPGDPYADYAYSNPLPRLPMLPKGYTLDPNKSDCRTANEWKVYCESNKLSK